MKISLSNADPNDWWVLGVRSNPPSTDAYDFVIQCDILTKQASTYIFADATLEVTGDSVRVRGGSVVTGSSIGGMTSTQPLHLHEVTRLL